MQNAALSFCTRRRMKTETAATFHRSLLCPPILAESVNKFKFSLDLLPYLVPFLQIFQTCFARISNEKKR